LYHAFGVREGYEYVKTEYVEGRVEFHLRCKEVCLSGGSEAAEGFDRAWSVRIGEQYRAVGERVGDKIIWTWIGTHNEFDKLFA
jgi:hypothetical protein